MGSGDSEGDTTEVVTPLRGSFVTDHLVDDLRRQITTGVLKAGDPVMPVRALSKTYKISYNSVRRALGQLSDEGYISLERGRGTFVKPLSSRAAPESVPAAIESEAEAAGKPGKGLKSLEGRQLFGLLFYAGTGPLFSAACYRDSLQAVEMSVLANGDVLTIISGHVRKPFPTPEQILSAGFDGVILLGIVDRKILAAFANSKLPCVLLDHWPGDIPLNCVVVDNFTGAYLLTKSLIHVGHRDVCFLRTSRSVTTGSAELLVDPDVSEREDACRLALKEEGQVLRSSHVLDISRMPADATSLADLVLALKPLPTAVFSSDLGMARMLTAQLKEKGHEVPRDFSVVTFSGKNDADPQHFTAAKADFHKMGEVGVGRLRQMMGGAPQSRLRINVPVEVVDGKTVGPPAKR
ncbi:MAG: substrate-binding domain-containing protein [Planctomycetes bacterium]|nr:substrate-binding domain-containing protein [Planctomycetota bacterium]